MVTVRVCSKLKTSWKLVVFTDIVGKNSRYFVGVFNKTIIPLALVGYEMIIANSYPTRTRGIIVKYIYFCFPTSSLGNTLIEENLQSIRCLYPAAGSTIWSHPTVEDCLLRESKIQTRWLDFYPVSSLSCFSIYKTGSVRTMRMWSPWQNDCKTAWPRRWIDLLLCR